MPEPVELVRRFEPILYLHPDERFFPSDAKRFLEHCALWRAAAPFDRVASWKGPLIGAGKIAAASNEVQNGDSYLGEMNGAIPRFLADSNKEERFLDLAGWRFSDTSGESVVEQFVTAPTSDEQNQFAHRDEVNRLYNDARDALPALRDSRFWYHAELFDTATLQRLMLRSSDEDSRILSQIFHDLRNPALLCYYFFFPGHDEGLTCGNPQYASFVGEWACMAILLERVQADGEFMPKWIGLSRRPNIGTRQARDAKERRIAMVVQRWRDKTDVHARLLPEAIEDHPKIFVAGGTHGLHLTAGTHAINPYTVESQPQWCGRFDSPDALAKFSASRPEDPPPTSLFKVIGGALFGLPFLAAGLAWGLVEGNWGVGISARGTGPSGDDAVPDVTSVGGKVVHPQSLSFAEPGAELIPWAVNQTMIAGRQYGFIVDRGSQVWWPNLDTFSGYRGRWGPRVSRDPFARRCGMRFPEFWRMFFLALAKELA